MSKTIGVYRVRRIAALDSYISLEHPIDQTILHPYAKNVSELAC